MSSVAPGNRRTGEPAGDGDTGRPAEPPRRPAPERAPDDSDVGWSDWRDADDDPDRWYREQRPPHHGG